MHGPSVFLNYTASYVQGDPIVIGKCCGACAELEEAVEIMNVEEAVGIDVILTKLDKAERDDRISILT